MRCWPLFSVLSILTRRVQPSSLTSQCSLLSGDLVGSSLWSTWGASTTSYISPGARHPYCSCTQSPSVVGCLRSGSRLMHLVPETRPQPRPCIPVSCDPQVARIQQTLGTPEDLLPGHPTKGISFQVRRRMSTVFSMTPRSYNADPEAWTTNTILHFIDYILCYLTQNAYGYIL